MKIAELIRVLEELAPPAYQESYDNSGLLVGNPQSEIEKALVCLDCTEAVVAEAINKKCGLIIAHHPVIFSGLKRLTGKTYIERVVMQAIQNNIAIYAIHTNLDNVAAGVNRKIGEQLGLQNLRILQPMATQLFKLVTFVPHEHTNKVLAALFGAGAGHIGQYEHCSFSNAGIGSFRALSGATPFVGEVGKRHYEPENRVEVVVPVHKKDETIRALLAAHPYEEVAYDVYALQNSNQNVGAGMVGELPAPMPENDFLAMLKTQLKTKCVRHTALLGKPVSRVAFCGGSGVFLMGQAIAAQADVFVTADVKYHQFFDAEEKLVLADVGHFESEQFTIDLLADYLMEKLPTFATLKTEVNTNPLFYF